MSYSVDTIAVTALSQNCRLLLASESDEAVVIDPGGDGERVAKALEGRKLKEIWLTHSHLDHCGGVADLREHFPDAVLLGHPNEAMFRGKVEEIAMGYGLTDGSMKNCPEPDKAIEGGETLQFAGQSFDVFFTPGHSPGHLSFYDSKNSNLFSGDVVFQGSIGRYDLPLSDGAALMRSIKEVILKLPDDTKIYPGHGPDTTLGVERLHNPYLSGAINV